MQRRRGRWLAYTTVGFVVIAIAAAAYWYLYARNYESTDDAYVAGDLVTVMPGRLVVGIEAEVRGFSADRGHRRFLANLTECVEEALTRSDLALGDRLASTDSG